MTGLRARLILSWILLAAAASPVPAAGGPDLMEMNLESLMNVTVVGASRYEQKLSEAPSYVTIVTRDDIRRFGYRTLGDILRSIPGVYSTYDRNYTYLGVRGFSPPGDYNSRFLLLLDGHRVNNSIYDQAVFGNESPVDVDLMERVEFVRGPSSSLYGSNAFFGIINVVTRRGGNVEGAELSGSAASYQTYQGRATYGREFRNGPEILVSGTAANSGGQNLYFPAYDDGDPANNNGVAVNSDGEQARNVFAKVAYGNFMLEGVAGHRKKYLPTGVYGTTFNDNRTYTVDDSAFLDLRYEKDLPGDWNLFGRLYYDYFHYWADYSYDPDLNKDYAKGRTWGAEAKAVKKIGDRHILTAGTEYRDNYQQDQGTFYVNPPVLVLDDQRDSYVWSAYLQWEFRILHDLILNAGLRYDDYETFGGNWSPRVGLIWSPWKQTSIKLLYGSAFRAPNVYELYYADGVGLKANPALEPETIDTYEAVLEQYVDLFGIKWKGTAAGYYYKIKNLITSQPDPADPTFSIFQNNESIEARGLELELDASAPGGFGGRASYSYQSSRLEGSDTSLSNSPRSTAKLNLVLPLLRDKVFLDPEVQYFSSRKTAAGKATESVGGYTVFNLTLFAQKLLKGLELSASAYNLLDRSYSDPVTQDFLQDTIPQDGRNYRVKATYNF